MTESEIFKAAIGLPPSQRRAYLAEACGANAELRAEVEALVEAHDTMGVFLHNPAAVLTSSEPSPAIHIQREEPSGSTIGPYKLLQRLGEGGMGAVYMAEQTHPVQRKVALKIVRPGMDSQQIIARFEHERQALALMEHPNIAKVLDAGTTEAGRPYFVMELVKGIPITTFCDQERLTPAERFRLFLPVCQAVQHAHQKGIIHRDLKPSNVLVALYDGHPIPKVIDFGVAKAVDRRLTDRTLFTEVGSIVGTLEYMAPEQAELNNLDIDTRADIYSLGVILYELLTGAPPFTSEQLRSAAYSEMLRMIREVEPPRPSTKLSSSAELASIAAKRMVEPRRLARLVYGDLDWIVMKCLEKERGRRYETANGLAMDIARFLADQPVLAGPPSALYRAKKLLRRNKGPTLAASLVLLSLLAGFAGTTRGLVEARRQRDAMQEARKKAETNAVTAQRRELEAQQQAAIAQALNDFLQHDLLGQADIALQPGGPVALDPDVRVRTLVDRASQHVARGFADQPLTEAAIRRTIGNTYAALGRYGDAQSHLERSLELHRTELGSDHLETLTSMDSLGVLYVQQRKLDEAEALLAYVLNARRNLLSPQHPDVVVSKSRLAQLYKHQSRYDLAQSLYDEVLNALMVQHGADHEKVLDQLHRCADLHLQQGRFDLAEPVLKRVLDLRNASLGAGHPFTVRTKNTLAALYHHKGAYETAETQSLQNSVPTIRKH